MDLVKFFDQLPDLRRAQGTRHPLVPVLLMVVMAILSEKTGFRGFTRFMKANKKELIALFNLKHGVPSHVTLTTIFASLPIKSLTENFILWAGQYVDITDNEFVSGDGKTMRSTVTDPNNSEQSFVSVVSLFGQKTGISYAMIPFQNGKAYEGDYIKKLIDLCQLKGLIIDLDALHCQKKL
jgi:hypothetical protein